MTPSRPDLKLKQIKKISFKLNLVLFGVLSFYLITTGYSIQTLWQQAREFKTLTKTHFERAIHAAELSRNTELIASQALEKMLSQKYSNAEHQLYTKGIEQIFDTLRSRLSYDLETPQEHKLLSNIDQLKPPYFDSLKTLDEHLSQEENISSQQKDIESELQKLLKSSSSDANVAFSSHLLQLVSMTEMALHVDSPGHLHRLEESINSLLDELPSFIKESPQEDQRKEKIQQLSLLSISMAKQAQKQHLATLAAVRQTRLYAQHLSGACYDFYIALKNTTQMASIEHEKLINKVIYSIFICSLAFLALTALAYWFIQHYLIYRINKLSHVMLQHVEGIPAGIPQAGSDEIATMGKAFAVFVDATNKARDESRQAQMETEKVNKKLVDLNRSLESLSNTDDLTQISNRRFFFQRLHENWEQARNNHNSIGLVMLDLDWFKAYNDFYGHQAGDNCLYQIAQILKNTSEPQGGMVARYGGEEFIVMQVGARLEQIRELANMLSNAIKQAAIPHAKSPIGSITISMGVISHIPGPDDTVEQCIYLADKALYTAKNRGRSQIVESKSF